MMTKPRPFLDSEQMWRLEKQKRSLSQMSYENDEAEAMSPKEEDEDLFGFDGATSNESPKKTLRTDHAMSASLSVNKLSSQTTLPVLFPSRLVVGECFADDRDAGIVCRTPPCHKDPPCFANIEAFERHHHQVHALACIECRLHFPTERILSLHLEERHDPFVEVQRANHKYKVLSVSTPKQTQVPVTNREQYKCFVEGCNETFSGVVKRNEHLMFFHYFPAVYVPFWKER